MRRNRFLQVIILLSIFGCNSEIKEFDFDKLEISDAKLIKDSIILHDLILKNDTISGFAEWSSHNKEYLSNPDYYKLIRNRFDTNFWNHRNDSVFYLLDTIKIRNRVGYIVIRSYKMLYMGTGYDRTMFLSMFDNDNKYIKTIIIAESIDKGDGLIGGGTHSKSTLTRNGILTTYLYSYGYLDIGNPPYIMDSVIIQYNLRKNIIIKIDTIKSIKPIGYQ